MDKCKTCKHAISVGEMAVYVTPSCPRASMIRGVLVSSKIRCRECRMWKSKKGAEK